MELFGRSYISFLFKFCLPTFYNELWLLNPMIDQLFMCFDAIYSLIP